MAGLGQKDSYVGEEALSKVGILRLRHPVVNGVCGDWTRRGGPMDMTCDMEKVWHHMFYNELRVAPEEHCVLLAEKHWNPKANRDKAMELMFESFSVPAFCLAVDDVLALCSSGRTSGVTVGVGHGSCQVTPVLEGIVLKNASLYVSDEHGSTGDQLSQVLQALLEPLNYSSLAKKEVIRDVKEKVSYVALNFQHELQRELVDIEEKYELPDGQILSVSQERFRVPELLFERKTSIPWDTLRLLFIARSDPGSPFYNFPRDLLEPLVKHLRQGGLPCMIEESISKCGEKIIKELWGNVLLHGGSTMFPGTAERLLPELRRRSDGCPVQVIAPVERHISTWIGGSVMASRSTFSTMCISKSHYEETGGVLK